MVTPERYVTMSADQSVVAPCSGWLPVTTLKFQGTPGSFMLLGGPPLFSSTFPLTDMYSFSLLHFSLRCFIPCLCPLLRTCLPG